MRRQLPVSSPVSLAGLFDGARGALGFDVATDAVASALRERHAAAAVTLCDSGTSALVLALRAAVPPGGTVAMPSYSCVDLAAAARFTDVRVRLYDLDPSTLSADLDSLACTLRRGVDAVLAVHLYGFPADLPAMRRLADAHGTPLIEDAAQAAGARLGGRALGAFGDLAVLSFGRGKGTTGGRGGALMTASSAWTARVEQHLTAVRARPRAGWGDLTRAAAQWVLGRPALYAVPSAIPGLHLGEMVYHPAREPEPMTRAAAAVLQVALRRDGAEVARRRANAARLLTAIGADATVAATRPIAAADPGYLRFPVLDAGGRRPDATLGITRGYPRALYEQDELRPCLHADEREPLGGRTLRESLFTLPVHGRLTSQDLRRLCSWLGSARR